MLGGGGFPPTGDGAAVGGSGGFTVAVFDLIVFGESPGKPGG
jgi:hypothetical protein